MAISLSINHGSSARIGLDIHTRDGLAQTQQMTPAEFTAAAVEQVRGICVDGCGITGSVVEHAARTNIDLACGECLLACFRSRVDEITTVLRRVSATHTVVLDLITDTDIPSFDPNDAEARNKYQNILSVLPVVPTVEEVAQDNESKGFRPEKTIHPLSQYL